MQLKSFLALLATTFGIIAFTANSSFSQSHSLRKITFFCEPTYDKDSHKELPTTVAWVPQRNGTIRVIRWKSQYIKHSVWDEQTRCNVVSQKFQDYYNQGILNYVTHGIVNGYPVVCAVANPNQKCSASNQLFTLKSRDFPDLVLKRLMNILEGESGNIIEQGSEEQIYIPIKELFVSAPIVEKK